MSPESLVRRWIRAAGTGEGDGVRVVVRRAQAHALALVAAATVVVPDVVGQDHAQVPVVVEYWAAGLTWGFGIDMSALMFVALVYRLLVTVLTWLALLARSSSAKGREDTRAAP